MRKKIKNILFGILGVFILFFAYSAIKPSPVSGVGSTYYIDNSCPDTNSASATVDGSSYDPITPACTGGSDKYYSTIADINAAAATLEPGDTISFRKGLTWNEQLTIPESGTAGNIYTYTSFGTGNLPTIDAQSTRQYGIYADSKEYITISKLDVRNATFANIFFSKPKNVIVEKNYLYGRDASGHGIVIDGETVGGYDCSAIVRYNYSDTEDDCYWTQQCTTADEVKFYGNVCAYTGDDCFDVDDGDIYVANNTCINPVMSCWDVFDTLADTSTPTGTYINNICVVSNATQECDDGIGCFIYMPNDPALSPLDLSTFTIENNIYYSTNDSGALRFYIGEGTGTQISFTDWKLLAGTPDQVSQEINPDLNSLYYYVTNLGSPALKAGQNICDDIAGYLEVGSSWLDDDISVFRPCPSNAGNEWNIGAYGTRGTCPVSIKY